MTSYWWSIVTLWPIFRFLRDKRHRSKKQKKVGYRKHIARQLSGYKKSFWLDHQGPNTADPVKKLPRILLWSPCKIWLAYGFSYRVRTRIGDPKIWDDGAGFWGRGRGWPNWNTLLPRTCSHATLGRSWSNSIRANLREIRQKMGLTRASHLSRSLEVNGTDTHRSATYDFLLDITE